MNPFSLLVLMTFGTDISSYISKTRISGPICLALTTVKYATKPVSILSSVILFIVVGLTFVFRHCLTFDEAEKALNDCHSGACGGHMSRYATAQNIL
jgi:hypothetical protein